jgi:hypothetical protein
MPVTSLASVKTSTIGEIAAPLQVEGALAAIGVIP